MNTAQHTQPLPPQSIISDRAIQQIIPEADALDPWASLAGTGVTLTAYTGGAHMWDETYTLTGPAGIAHVHCDGDHERAEWVAEGDRNGNSFRAIGAQVSDAHAQALRHIMH